MLKAEAWTVIDIDKPEDVIAARRYVAGYNKRQSAKDQ